MNIFKARRQRLRETWKRRVILGSPNEMLWLEGGQQGGLQAASAQGLGVLVVAMAGCNLQWGQSSGALIPLFPPRLVQEHGCAASTGLSSPGPSATDFCPGQCPAGRQGQPGTGQDVSRSAPLPAECQRRRLPACVACH